MRRPPNARLVESVDDAVVDVLQKMTPSDSVAAIVDANDTARLLSAAGVRYLYPTWTEQQVQAEVARRMLDAAN